MEKLRIAAASAWHWCRGKGKQIAELVKAWPIVTKAAVPCSVLLMLAGSMLLAAVLHQDLSVTVEPDTETETSELWATELEMETETGREAETETEMDTEDSLEVLAQLPQYTSVTMVTESMEQDLTIYLEDEDGANLEGINFEVKLIETEQLAQLQEYIDAIADSDVTEYVPPTGYEELELSEEELQLLKKQDAISAYAEALAAVSGEVLTDDDADGMIYADGLDGGDYVLCFVPILQYDATEYALDVTVKDEIEYVAVTTITKKVVSEDTAGDQKSTTTHTNTTVETVAEDTVEEVVSSEEVEETSSEVDTSTEIILASVSEELNTTSVLCELTEDSVSEEGGTEVPSSVQVTLTSTLSISKSILLYANKYANSATVLFASENVTELQITASDELSCLKITETDGGYLVTVSSPSNVTDDQTGTLALAGLDALGNPISVTCEVTVVGADTLLTDSEGNQLYTMDSSGELSSVKVGEYNPATTYYTLAETITYYGWQTIDGETYYFDGTGAAVTGTQTINGVTYHFGTDGALITAGFGIDVSKWQGTIDWEQASQAISFAIIRCGFRGTSGKLAEDSMYSRNITQAKKYGVKVGLYFYSTAQTEAEAVEEASLAVSLAKEAGTLDLPIFIDMEDSTQESLTTAQRDKIVLAFCKTVENSGYQAGVYANKNWLTTLLTPSKYSGYTIWCAQYNTTCTYTGRYEIWQYSSKGTIPGIDEYVDLNWGYFE